MPTGAILYVQVPDSTTWDDWNRWRAAFLDRAKAEEKSRWDEEREACGK